jgi:hypothetical protein
VISTRGGRLHRFDRELLARRAPYRGSVEAVYRGAAVVRPDEGGYRLTLLGPSRGLVPWGVQIPWDPAPAVGERVHFRGRLLTIGSAALELEGEGAPLSLRDAAPAVAAHRALNRLNRLPAVTGCERDPGWALLRRRLAALVRTLLRWPEDQARVQWAASRLVGLGAGSTPSGDDLLLGVAAAGWRWLHPDRLRCYLQAIGGLPGEATTPVSREMLEHAAQGAFPAPLRDFVLALTARRVDEARLSRLNRVLLAVGACSGAAWREGVGALARALGEGGLG